MRLRLPGGDRLRLRHLALACLLFALIPPPALRAQAPNCPPRLALVLSGGGAKGFAHIGLIQVLDSLGIRPDLVVGTSMGALIGALYASGMTGEEIEWIAGRLPLEEMFKRGRSPALSRLGPTVETVEWLEPLLVWERRERSFQLRSPAAREDAVNAVLTRVLLPGNLQAAGSFDRMVIPFRAIATDLRNRRTVVLDSGDLAQAVRASIAIPGVFTPVVIDGTPLVDGGFSQNLPLGPARHLGAERLLASDVIERPEESVKTGSAVAVIEQVFDLMLHEGADSLGPHDLEIRPSTVGIGTLDFTRGALARLVAVGRAAARDTLRGVRGLPGAAVCRAEPPGPAPEPALVDELRARLQALQVLAPEAVWLYPSRVGDSLAFAPVAELQAPGRVVAGLGYDNQRGGHAWGGIEDVGIFAGRARASGTLFVGELERSAVLSLSGPGLRHSALTPEGDRERLPDPRSEQRPWRRISGLRVRPNATFHALSADVRHFDAGGHRSATTVFQEALGFVGLEAGTGGSWFAATGGIAQTWSGRDTTWSGAPSSARSIGWLARGGWMLGPPGSMEGVGASDGVIGEALWTTTYHRLLLAGSVPAHIGAVELRARGQAGWGDRLPVGQTFVLGGREGFPGFVAGERRGDRVFSLALAGTRWIQGPIYVRAELATGATARGGPVLPTRGWVGGASAGLLASTPLGSAYVGYGSTTSGRGAVLVQLGEP